MSDIPDGVNLDVARAAIAWQMVKLSLLDNTNFARSSAEDKMQILLEIYATAWDGLFSKPQKYLKGEK